MTHFRRREILGAIGVGAAFPLLDLLGGCAGGRAAVGGGSVGASASIRYFDRFGVDEALLRQTLTAALSKGGARADVFFQHRVLSTMSLEDGAVSRASTLVQLGAGVRVLIGDQ